MQGQFGLLFLDKSENVSPYQGGGAIYRKNMGILWVISAWVLALRFSAIMIQLSGVMAVGGILAIVPDMLSSAIGIAAIVIVVSRLYLTGKKALQPAFQSEIE